MTAIFPRPHHIWHSAAQYLSTQINRKRLYLREPETATWKPACLWSTGPWIITGRDWNSSTHLSSLLHMYISSASPLGLGGLGFGFSFEFKLCKLTYAAADKLKNLSFGHVKSPKPCTFLQIHIRITDVRFTKVLHETLIARAYNKLGFYSFSFSSDMRLNLRTIRCTRCKFCFMTINAHFHFPLDRCF